MFSFVHLINYRNVQLAEPRICDSKYLEARCSGVMMSDVQGGSEYLPSMPNAARTLQLALCRAC